MSAIPATTTAVVVPPSPPEPSIKELKAYPRFLKLWDEQRVFGEPSDKSKAASDIVHDYIGARGLQIMARQHQDEFQFWYDDISLLFAGRKPERFFQKAHAPDSRERANFSPHAAVSYKDFLACSEKITEDAGDLATNRYAFVEKIVLLRFPYLIPHLGGIARYFELPYLKEASFRESGHQIARVNSFGLKLSTPQGIDIAVVRRNKKNEAEEVYVSLYAPSSASFPGVVKLEAYAHNSNNPDRRDKIALASKKAEEIGTVFEERVKKGSALDPTAPPPKNRSVTAAIVDLAQPFVNNEATTK
jgi:hypothetical protein